MHFIFFSLKGTVRTKIYCVVDVMDIGLHSFDRFDVKELSCEIMIKKQIMFYILKCSRENIFVIDRVLLYL